MKRMRMSSDRVVQSWLATFAVGALGFFVVGTGACSGGSVTTQAEAAVHAKASGLFPQKELAIFDAQLAAARGSSNYPQLLAAFSTAFDDLEQAAALVQPLGSVAPTPPGSGSSERTGS